MIFMKKLIVVMLLGIFTFSAYGQTKVYHGAWFDIKYPESFKVKESIPSETGGEGTFDSAIFTSPSGEVEFYIYSPKLSGEPTDIALQGNEELMSKETKEGKIKTVTYWTIRAKDDSYTRSYQQTQSHLENTRWVVGIKYTHWKAYQKYQKEYLIFKKSLEQFAD